MAYEVSSGVTESGIILENNTMTVLDGGIANDTTVNNRGSMNVAYGGVANGTTVNSGGRLSIVSGGTVNSTTVNGSGSTFVSQGGRANSTTVNSGARLQVGSGATAAEIMENGGYVHVVAGADVSFAPHTISGFSLNQKNSATIHSGTTATDATVAGGSMYVFRGGMVNGAAVNSDGRLYVSSGGTANGITVNTGGSLYISSGATAGIVFNPWQGSIYTGSGANVTYFERDANIYFGEARGVFISKTDTADSLTIVSEQSVIVFSGGTANNTTVNPGGFFTVSSGGNASNIVENGGYVHVADGANVSFQSCTLSGLELSNVSTTVHSGTTAVDIAVNTDAWLYVFSGATAGGATVNSGGTVVVMNGGVASGLSTTSSGFVVVSSGGLLKDACLSGGISARVVTVEEGGIVSSTRVLDGVDLYVFGSAYDIVLRDDTNTDEWDRSDLWLVGGFAENVTMEKRAFFMASSAVANNITVNSSCEIYVSTGGAVNNITINFGGSAAAVEGGAVNSTTLNSGGSLDVSSGGTANGTTVNSGGRFYIFGGTVNGTTVNSGGYLYFSSYNGGAMNGVTLNSGGYFYVYCGTVNGTTVNSGGSFLVSSGGITSNTTINSGAVFYVSGDCTTDSATINNGGRIYVLGSGIAENTTVNSGGSFYISRGGLTDSATVNNGGRIHVLGSGVAENTTVSSGGSLLISSGGTANRTTVNDGGSFSVSSGVIANSTTVNAGGTLHLSSGGTANRTTVNDGGSFSVSRGGSANSTTVSGGCFHISSGGTATGITIRAGARLEIGESGMIRSAVIQSGGLVTGHIDCRDVTFDPGATLQFDLSALSPGKESAPVNLAGLAENPDCPSFSLTFSEEQEEGMYKLAAGATGFDGTITVKNTYGADLGTLKVGEKVYIGKDDYTLTLTDDVLTVAINAPTVTEANGDVLLEGAMPKARYMYGCVNTSIAMILGYYDLYGYRGKDFSALIEGDVELDSRGTGYDIYKMDDFDSNLGKANASRDYVERFFSKDSIEAINARTNTETTPAEELPYSFVNDGAGQELRTDVWNCLADYFGTGQFWRGNDNLYATSDLDMLEVIMNDNVPFTVTDEATGIQRTIEHKYTSCLYGLYLYVRDKGYDLDRKTTKISQVDVAGGTFTFDDFMKEIDAGRAVMVLVRGHAMVGYGYNAETREIILDNCLAAGERMVWDGTYNYAVERPLEAICTFGLMTADTDIDLAVSPFDEESGITERLILATAEGQTESVDYCFAGSPLYLSLAVSNLGTTASGGFDVAICCDGEKTENIHSLSLDPETIRRESDIQLPAELGVGLHSISVRIDPDNRIQEMYALNNSDERSIMVLKAGTNVVEGIKTVVSGEVSSDDYVMNGAGIQVLEGGTAEGTLIQGKVTSRSLDGNEVRTTPGSANVSRGGLIRNAAVYEYGQLELSGTAEDLDVRKYGNAVVSSGGIVSGVFVDKAGKLALQSGGKLTGRIDVESGASVSFEEGGILNFDLTGTTAGAEALVNDLSIIQGTPTFTITVDGTEAKGMYTLAEGAENFASTITVRNTTGDELGMLTVGEKVRIGGDDYTLNLIEGALSVSFVPDVTAPVITLTADTETVVLQTTLTATIDDGSTIQYRIGEFGLWKEYKEPIIASLNETYYFMAMDDAGNIGTNQITFGNIDTSGVLLSTLWSQRGINPMGGNNTIMYNEYTPLDPSVDPEAHSLTGCVNTAAGQLIYYFIEKGWLDLPLTLEEKDEYTSKHKATTEGGDAIVIPVKSDGTTRGTLSFAEINAMLSDFQLDSAEHAAALLYAIGVVLESKYSASSTGTSWNRVFFKRAGFEGETMGGPYFGEYYWGDMDDEMQYTITDAGFEVLIENLEAGLPVGATYPGHAFVIDGYDRESDTFHINLGWGGNQATRWYTRDEMQEDLNCEYFVYDLNPEYVETFTVTDARVYGTGTMIRAFEKAAGMIGDNTVAFDPSVAGKTVELLNHITFFDEVISVKDFNMNVLVTESQGGENSYGFHADHIDVFESSDPVTVLTFHASGGSLIVSTENEFNYAFQMADGLSCTVDANGMLIWAGKSSEGTEASAVLQALQTCRNENTEVSGDLLDPNGWSYNGSAGEDVFRLANSSLAVGKVSLGGGDDVLSLTGHSRLYGNIDAGDGSDTITIDSTSSISGDLTGKCDLHFVLAERDDHAMFTIRSSASGLCADATVTVDMKDAELGTYTLISAATGATGITDLKDLAVTVTGSGEGVFTLSVNGTSTSDYADLIFEDNSLKLQVKKEPVKQKWTYLMYFAADNDLDVSALNDLISIQRANIDEGIDVYVLVDRPEYPWDWEEGALPSVNGTYEWDSLWTDTRVGKIKHDTGLTVTVDWESWGELDTGSAETLDRFVKWVQAESPAENYALVLWDHGEEFATLCYDFTTDPDLNACLTVSDVSEVVKKNGNIPLVIFNSCLNASDIATTQMAGTTDVMVAPESPSMSGGATYAYWPFFSTITADMTAREMAEVLVRNVREATDMPYPSMLTAIDVTDTRLADSLKVLAEAVLASGNIEDRNVLINAMLTAPQHRCLYEGGMVMQSDLKDMILQAKADPGFSGTSEEFRTALASVESSLGAVVLDYRSAPGGSGYSIGFANTINVSEKYLGLGYTADKVDKIILNYLTTWYGSNPEWADLLHELAGTYLARNAGARTAVFDVVENSDLVDSKVVQVNELGCFSGRGETIDGVTLDGDVYFGFTVTEAEKSAGGIRVVNDAGVSVSVSLLAGDGSVLVNGDNTLMFSDLAAGDYFLCLASETKCDVVLSFDADWLTGVDRFDFAGSGSNEKKANGNATPDTASVLGAGYYSGMLTSMGDSDFYQFVNTGTDQVRIAVESLDGSNCLHVRAFSPKGIPGTGSKYKEGVYTLTMSVGDRLFVEGDANLDKDQVNAYSITVIPYEETPVVLSNLNGTKDGASWEASEVDHLFSAEYSTDGFEHVLSVQTSGWGFDTPELPKGTYQWRVKVLADVDEEGNAIGDDGEWIPGNEIVSDNVPGAPKVVQSNADGNADMFFASPTGTWNSIYRAKHVGSSDGWTGTNEVVSAKGKGRIQNLFFGSADVNTLYLTDSENGDALFVDDVYTSSPEGIAEKTARLFQISEIYAGAGDDIVDMTSQRFAYTGDLTAIHGGDGNDVIWANSGDNQLFGDAGDDRIVGSSGYDFIVGGIGNDRMHGGGGDDIFTFCENWGEDTVEQLADGSVLLWFASGREENWDESTLTYTDGENIVKVSGVTADQITLKFGNDWSMLYTEVELAGGFLDFSSQRIFSESVTKKIFEDTDKGILASV